MDLGQINRPPFPHSTQISGLRVEPLKMTHPTTLSSLTEREAVIDAMYRFCLAIDDNSPELLDSASYKGEDACFILGDHKIEGSDTIRQFMFDKIMPLQTTHHITNVRADVKEGADTAHMTCTSLVQHYKPEDAFKPDGKSFLTGGMYLVDLVKDSSDGLWKLKNVTLKLKWFDGDRSIMSG